MRFFPLLQPSKYSNKNPSYVECTRQLQCIANLCKSTIDGYKHNSTMVSDASQGTATPKINESFIHMAHVSSNRACAQDGYSKRPHPTIIDGDMRQDSGLVFGWFLNWGTPDTHQLGGSQVKTHTPIMAAAIALWLPWCPPPGTAGYNNQPTCCATSLCRREYYCFYYLFISYFKA